MTQTVQSAQTLQVKVMNLTVRHLDEIVCRLGDLTHYIPSPEGQGFSLTIKASKETPLPFLKLIGMRKGTAVTSQSYSFSDYSSGSVLFF